MKLTRKLISKLKGQRGATAVVIVLALVVLIGFAALAIDIGYLYATKNELQNAADAAALAGAGLLGQIYDQLDKVHMATYDCTEDTWSGGENTDYLDIKAQAQAVVGANKNPAGGKDIGINFDDIFINQWHGTVFNSDNTSLPDAVRVIARRDESANDPITTFFARILGIDTAVVTADATAALTGPAIVDEGEMNLPIGLSMWQFFDDCIDDEAHRRGEAVCSEEITFSPTTDSCAGWHNFFDPINADAEAEKLIAFIEGNECNDVDCADVPSGEPLNGHDWLEEKFNIADNKLPEATETPVTTAGDDAFFFQGGTISSLFNGGWLMWNDPEGDRVSPLMDGDSQVVDGNAKKPAPFPALFDYFRFRDGDGDNSVWTATAPVYDDPECCSNPNTELPIIGFAQVVVRMPNPPPDSTVTATVSCDWTIIDARGGGGEYGNLKGKIPNLVE